MERVKSKTSSVVIVGGGIVGSSTAIALLGRGHQVTLIDDTAQPPSASWGNAGHIAIEQTEPLASLATLRSAPSRLLSREGSLALPWADVAAWLPFATRLARAAAPARFERGHAALAGLLAGAMPAWERHVRAIGDESLLVRRGHIILWDTPDSARRGRQAWSAKTAVGVRFRDLDDAENRSIAALLGREPAGAICCEGSASIASHDLLEAAFSTCFTQLGGAFIKGRAVVGAQDGHVSLDVPGVGRLHPDHVVIAAGVSSRAIMEALGFRAPMIAERGYHVSAPGARWPDDLPPIVFEDRSMIVTRFRDAVRASSFVEFSRHNRPPDPGKWAALRRRIAELNLPFELPGKEWMGSRPTLPDYLPAIGRSRHHDNLLYAFGHQHLGLTLGPLTGEIMSDLVERARPGIDLAPFDVERFGSWSARRRRNRAHRF